MLSETTLSQEQLVSPPETSDKSKFWQIIMKVVGPCNMGCDYCYMYTKKDTSWRDQPRFMEQETVEIVAERLAEHRNAVPSSSFEVKLHGGEPLMAGPRRLAGILKVLQQADPTLTMSIQTNATLITPKLVDEVLLPYSVRVGASLDGNKEADNRHRVFLDGRSSYERTVRGINVLKKRAPQLFDKLLAVIDLANDPRETYQALAELEPPNMDFLLPHHTWDDPPPGKAHASDPSYGRWWMGAYDAWQDDSSLNRPLVRTFRSIERLIEGKSSLTELIGPSPVSEIVIQPNGLYEQVDSLSVTYDGARAVGMNVREHSLAEAMAHPAVHARTLGREALLRQLSETCQQCPIVNVCGGGFPAHRFGQEDGFSNPSVFCADYIEIISYVAGSMRTRAIRQAVSLPQGIRYGRAF